MEQVFYKYYQPRHKRAARMLGHTLTLNDEQAWWSLAALLSITLTKPELAELSYSVLMAMNEREAVLTAEAALFHTQRPDGNEL